MQWKAYFDKIVKKDFFIKKNAVKSLNQFSGVTIWKMKKKVFLSWDSVTILVICRPFKL